MRERDGGVMVEVGTKIIINHNFQLSRLCLKASKQNYKDFNRIQG